MTEKDLSGLTKKSATLGEEVAKNLDDYGVLVNDCKPIHLEPNKKENICNHCYQDLELPKTRAEIEHSSQMDFRKNLPIMEQPLDVGYWMERIHSDIENEKSLNFYRGFGRYLESLKNEE
ncbi:MAG: hypothetical protein KC516_04520 [Nanoarchaeota archaeon]|nr:hypothetical protein [Nanoarchaeota archaeon]